MARWKSPAIPRTSAPAIAEMPLGAEDDGWLSIEKCRKLIGMDSKLTDAEILRLRDSFYAFADIFAAEFAMKTDDGRQPHKQHKIVDQIAAA